MTNSSSGLGLRPCQRPGVRFERRGKRALISDIDQSKILSRNPSAAAVWELCDGRTTIDEMVMAICEVTSVRPDQARQDVEMTIATLEGAGFLAFNSPASERVGLAPPAGNEGADS